MKGLSPRKLKYMRAFAEGWPEESIVQAVLAQITWYHNLAILERLDTSEDRIWYTVHLDHFCARTSRHGALRVGRDHLVLCCNCYQLDFVFQAGSLTTPASASTPQGMLRVHPRISWPEGFEVDAFQSFCLGRGLKLISRFVERFVGERKCTPVHAEHVRCAAVLSDLNGLLRIGVLCLHEPSRRVGAYRENRDQRRAKPFADLFKNCSVAISSVSRAIDQAGRRFQNKSSPKRHPPIPKSA